MTKGTTKHTAAKAKPRTPSGAARRIIIPKKTGPLSAKRIREAIEQIFAAKAATQS